MAEQKKSELIERYGLTAAVLNKTCSDEHILEIRENISWREVGQYLFPRARVRLSDIERDGHDEEEKRRLMLDVWQEREGDGATYDKLIEAMVKAGKNAQATEVCKLIMPVYRPTEESSSRFRRGDMSPTTPAVPRTIPPSCNQGKLRVECYKKKSAPCSMNRGSTTTDGQFAYFRPNCTNSIYRYHWSTEEWKELPQSPYYNSDITVIDGALTTIGGVDGGCHTSKLFTLQQGLWVEKYSVMNTELSGRAVVITLDGNYIIAIGGYGCNSSNWIPPVFMGDDWSATVELFQVSSGRWYKLSNLPRALSLPSATICGNQLHVIGCDGYGYSCSVDALPSVPVNCTLQSISCLLKWTPLPHLPVKDSTAATLFGQLVIIGGVRYWQRVNSIHQLVDGQWVKIGTLSSGSYRCMCFVVSPSPDKLMILGSGRVREDDSVEECVVV